MKTAKGLLGSRISLGQEDRHAQKATKKDLARSQFATLRNNSSAGSFRRAAGKKRGALGKTNKHRQSSCGHVKNNVSAHRKKKKKPLFPSWRMRVMTECW